MRLSMSPDDSPKSRDAKTRKRIDGGTSSLLLRLTANDRRPLRDLIRAELVDAVLSGRLAPGEGLTETELAHRLCVSRTPLREAIASLEEGGFFRRTDGKGLSVSPLSLLEARELYPVLSALESLWVRTLAIRGAMPASIVELSDRIEGVLPHRYQRAFALLEQWYEELLDLCGNVTLRQEVLRYHLRAIRYELAFARSVGVIPWRTAVPRAVVTCLRARDTEGAVRALSSSRMETGVRIGSWLSSD